jgi:hypothetical protein
VLLVEDEALIAIYLEDIMKSLGVRFLGPISTVTEAVRQAQTAKIDPAILNWIVGGQPAHAVAEALDERKIPFGFASGVLRGAIGTKWADRPLVTKPHTIDGLRELLGTLLAESS